MIRSVYFVIFVSVVGFFGGCSHKAVDEKGESEQKAIAKEASEYHSAYKLKEYKEQTLGNGLRVLSVPDHSLPRVSVGIIIMAGSARDLFSQLGLASLTGSVLEGGTKRRSASQLAEDLGQIASSLDIRVDEDNTFISCSSLSNEKARLLELFADVLLNPAFKTSEVEREKKQTLSMIKKRQDNPSHYADYLMNRENFAGHPYGHAPAGEINTVSTFHAKDLKMFYQRFYVPQNAILFVTGDFDENFLKDVKKAFASWRGIAVEPWAALPSKIVKPESIKLFTRPDLKQAQIRFTERGIKRTDPDYLPIRLANMILGGSFSSRLNTRVRAELGLTYSIHSEMDARLDAGAFNISTFTRNEKVAETVTEIKNLVKKFIDKGVTEDELNAAKAVMSGQFPSAIETTDKLVYNLLLLRTFGINDDYLKNYISNLSRVSLSQVNAVIKKHFNLENYKIIVYADKNQVLKALEPLGSVEIIQFPTQ